MDDKTFLKEMQIEPDDDWLLIFAMRDASAEMKKFAEELLRIKAMLDGRGGSCSGF